MLVKILRTLFALVTAFIVMGIIAVALRAIGPFVGGVLILAFDLESSFETRTNLEAIGNIFALAIAIYFSVKTYKALANKGTSDPE